MDCLLLTSSMRIMRCACMQAVVKNERGALSGAEGTSGVMLVRDGGCRGRVDVSKGGWVQREGGSQYGMEGEEGGWTSVRDGGGRGRVDVSKGWRVQREGGRQ